MPDAFKFIFSDKIERSNSHIDGDKKIIAAVGSGTWKRIICTSKKKKKCSGDNALLMKRM